MLLHRRKSLKQLGDCKMPKGKQLCLRYRLVYNQGADSIFTEDKKLRPSDVKWLLRDEYSTVTLAHKDGTGLDDWSALLCI